MYMYICKYKYIYIYICCPFPQVYASLVPIIIGVSLASLKELSFTMKALYGALVSNVSPPRLYIYIFISICVCVNIYIYIYIY